MLAHAATHLMLTPTVTLDGAGPPPAPGTLAEMLPAQPVGSTRPSGSVVVVTLPFRFTNQAMVKAEVTKPLGSLR